VRKLLDAPAEPAARAPVLTGAIRALPPQTAAGPDAAERDPDRRAEASSEPRRIGLRTRMRQLGSFPQRLQPTTRTRPAMARANPVSPWEDNDVT